MAGHLGEQTSPGLWFAVDGERFDVPGWHWYPHRWACGAFTADYGLLRRLLPSPPLYPVRDDVVASIRELGDAGLRHISLLPSSYPISKRLANYTWRAFPSLVRSLRR